ncbi:putative uracil-DNA glycosylase,phage-related protein [Cupriavidus taiwanensis]|uniref:uracil-DNA glycosylase n=1 Tax=Cupriavidus taiwanensis TaxID=164546 RepID=UPI000E14F42E|nr:uracil-DNA glycosylase [Cupriavidus taiwanensis]SOY79616.1 putative uracil-DNA glycosylase,phage-related protein [Cupriavidus taiwanensis]SOY81589.1 putative uracil-DNA glycosylase,phage-related protein [Cupriavidus taiwanensis]
MSRRAQFLEVLGIPTEWVPRASRAAQAEAQPGLAAQPAAMPAAEPPAAMTAAPVAAAVTHPEAPPAAPLAPPAPDRAAPALVPARLAPDAAQAEREAAIAAMDWPALEAAVAGCTACGLCQTRTNTVFGVGARQAEWMLVGEAPGENEDLQGEPFVGQAGKLLDNMLGALGLARGRNVFIANVLKCRPPGNRNPEAEEVAQCEPFLRRQIALVRPRVIVVLGRFAAQSLLRTTTPIGKLRGTVHAYEGIPVVVTYHPAYLLRTLTDKARAWEDLCLAREVHDRAGAGA